MNTLKHLFLSLRPKQWIKNLLVFAALIFAQRLFIIEDLLKVWEGFFIFCGLSGAIYLINDICDVEKDRQHPKKRNRPIAAGVVPMKTALATALVLFGLGLGFGFRLGFEFVLVATVYTILTISYSFFLKNFVILDVLIVSAGFVLRAIAGALIISVVISPWLLSCTLFLALFLSVGKRLHEFLNLTDASGRRRSLEEYTQNLLDSMLITTATASIISYTLYTQAEETVRKFGTGSLIYTVPFVVYGVFRYLYLIYQKNQGESPSEVFLTDIPLLLNIFLWGVCIVGIIYWQK